MWTLDALWLANQFKLDRMQKVQIEGVLALRLDKDQVLQVTEDDIWRFIEGKL
jgi:hypothetical protein